MLPRISLITPCFNGEKYLEETIESVLANRYPNLEYIVVDGGSTDESPRIIRKYERHLTYWCSEPDGGPYDAITKGLRRATGDVFGWLNGDDVYCPWALRTVGAIFESFSSMEWISTLNPGLYDAAGFHLGFGSIAGFSRNAFLAGRYVPFSRTRASFGSIQQESTFWRRSLWERAGGVIPPAYGLAGDFALWCAFYALGAELCGVSSPLASFRAHAAQRSRNAETYLTEAKRALHALRRQLEWREDGMQSLAFDLRLHRMPGPRALLRKTRGERGVRLIRKDHHVGSGRWEKEPYTFI